jgi:hypothetical protein
MAEKYAEQQLALNGLYAYNFFAFSDVEQAAFTGLTDMLTTASARTSLTAGVQYAFERDRHVNDLRTAVQGLGISDANIAADNTVATFQARLAAFDSNLTGKESQRIHYVR